MALLGNFGAGLGAAKAGSIFDREAAILSKGNLDRVRFHKTRRYLDDYQKFSSAFTLKNLVMQVIKGACLPLLGITKELEAHNKEQLQAYERGEKFDKDFDWKGAVERQLPTFISSTQRFYITSIIRRGYDLCLLLNYPPKLVDHFTKDVTKSAVRKINRLGRTKASLRMCKTALLGGFLNYFSSLTYDILFASFEYLRSKKKEIDVVKTLQWLSKRTLYYAVLVTSSTAGFSLGTLIGDKGQVTSTIFALITETLAGEIAGRYLN
jgi:hypothetical protein